MFDGAYIAHIEMTLNAGKPRAVVFFDLDGVMVHECGVAEQGYGFVLQLLDDPDFDHTLVATNRFDLISVKQKYIDLGNQLRYKVKGKHPVNKIKILCQILGKQSEKIDPTAISRAQLAFQRSYIERNWPLEKYVVQGSLELLARLRKLPSVIIGTCTANTNIQAEWLLEYIGAREYFDFIAGYGDLPNEQITTKADIIQTAMEKYPNVQSRIMIGDGIPDMVAGKATGCYSIGIAYGNDPVQEKGLWDANADTVVAHGDYMRIYDIVREKAQ